MTEAQKKAKAKYRSTKVRSISFELYQTEQDIIDHLYRKPNRSAYIKQLIRDDMNRGK